MAKRSKYPLWGVVAIISGIALTSVEVVGAVSYLVGQVSPSYLIAGGALITAIAAIVPLLAARCWREKRYLLALFLWAAMIPALSLVFSAAVERTGGARDEAGRDRQVIAQKIELARSTERDAKVDVAADEAKASTECSKAPGKGVDPRGPLCKAAESRAEASRQRLQAARDKVAQAGVVPTDPQARRLAAILPGITEDQVALYQPLVLPIAISVLGLLLITVGAHTPQPVQAKRKVRRRRSRKSPTKRTAKVLPFPATRKTG